jgi:hypothetical protein
MSQNELFRQQISNLVTGSQCVSCGQAQRGARLLRAAERLSLEQ